MASCRVSLGWLILVVMIGFFGGSEAYIFTVGGKSGWVRQPSEGYDKWAARYRFQVADALLFLYKKGVDSVLVVTRDDYISCNTKSPLISFTDGNSLFVLDRSGPFYFISGNPNTCNSGQKMITHVLAQRRKPPMPLPRAKPPHCSLAPGASPSGINPGHQAPAPSRGSAPARRSYSRAMYNV